MFLDSLQQLAAAQVLAASGFSTNVLDLGVDRDIGIGVPLSVVIVISAIDAVDGNETYTVQPQAATDAVFTTPVAVGGLVNIPRAIGPNSRVVVPIPADTAMDRFFRLSFTLGGTTPSITYTAYLIPTAFLQNNNVFPVGTKIT